MAVLLHVMGAGRDPVRPFGGHLVSTVAWERFDASESPGVDAVVLSAPSADAAMTAVRSMRDHGVTTRVLVLPDATPGWRDLADARLPDVDLVIGGPGALSDYIAMPASRRPTGTGEREGTGSVVALRPPNVPRGPGRSMLAGRLQHHGPAVAKAVESWALELTGAQPTPAAPVPEAPRRPSPAEVVAAARENEVGLEVEVDVDPRDDAVGPTAEPATAGTLAHDPLAVVLPETDLVTVDDRFADSRSPVPSAVPEARPVGGDTPGTGQTAPLRDVSGRRLTRMLEDPAVLTTAALAQASRLVDAAHATRHLAEYLVTYIGADAVEVLVPHEERWRTDTTVGDCPGSGRVPEVVDVPGLVAWLVSSFDAPVVLDGSDLGAPGSWVLAGPVTRDGHAVGLVLAWRRPGAAIFDPAAVTAMAEVTADAAGAVALAGDVRRLARALAEVTD